jgi:hypothetical protein
MVALDTGTNFPAVSTISLFAIIITKFRQRMNGKGVPTQSQPQAASLTLSACNVAITLKLLQEKCIQNIPARECITASFCFSNSTCGMIALDVPYIYNIFLLVNVTRTDSLMENN